MYQAGMYQASMYQAGMYEAGKSSWYHIAVKFQGRKLSRIGEKYDFRKFLSFAMPKDTMPQILRRKL